MDKDFIPTFDQNYLERMAVRGQSFRIMFEAVQKIRKNEYFILETGCLRYEDNWFWDGMSTHVFDQFVGLHGGRVSSIDINRSNIEVAQRYCSARTTFYCGDSVKVLYQLAKQGDLENIDLLYLDSFDLDKKNHLPSAFHHMKEISCVLPLLKQGTVICVDDNIVVDNKKIGKGVLVAELMNNIGAKMLFDGYQMVWQLQ